MTVEELREAIKDLPGDMFVGGLDENDQYLEAEGYLVRPDGFDDEIFCMWHEYLGE